ncbi:MAG: 4-hydroxy-3-methylbut-2-enyl diphosphate reductase [Tannerellaceae bacterium]|jgi:4-hydroxy-3-methylbut-2-enyl diphosphate reductase|nr:4-hydroxy-3-methylbut-2-enyl diphosphate reductase [Tannerellaceae bacterium]
MEIEIDRDSGFCFGVVRAIEDAERELRQRGNLYCLGDIVHNNLEVRRLTRMGLVTITHEALSRLHDTTVLFRAHGEPPETYDMAQRNGLTIVDATCPVVLRLQRQIRQCYEESREKRTQVVIYGKKGHAEVNGLVGQTHGDAIVVENERDLDKLDYQRDVALFAQTTKSEEGFHRIAAEIERRVQASGARLTSYDSICRQVSKRLKQVSTFAATHDVIFFVTGEKSSNGRVLFEECRRANPLSFLVSGVKDIAPKLPSGVHRIGICGATSTPKWLMEEVADYLRGLPEEGE